MPDPEVRPPDDTPEEGEFTRTWLAEVVEGFGMTEQEIRALSRESDDFAVIRFKGRPPKAVCKISVIRERQRWEVVWLLPLGARIPFLAPLLRDTATEAGRRFGTDRTLLWPIRGSFGFGLDAQMRALAWQEMFSPNVSEVRGIPVPGSPEFVRWSIQVETMQAAIRAVSRWRDTRR